MQKITPHLWFDKEAKEAAEFYVSVFGENSKIKNVTTLHDTPSGSVDVVSFELFGQAFMAISAGPLFKFNPSVSFHVKCKTIEDVDELWKKLIDGGKALMELGEYPFSKRYGWLQDKYGLSWQIIYTSENKITQTIIPVLMYVGSVCGKAEEAINFYTSVFSARPGRDLASGGRDGKIEMIVCYHKGEEPDKEGTVQYAHFTLNGMEFGAMDSAHEHNFSFNEAISFIVHCNTQEEIDYYWNKLSAVPESEQCGWLKDKYGLSWQIVPTILDEMMKDKDKKRVDRVTKSFLAMNKLNIKKLEEAYEGR